MRRVFPALAALALAGCPDSTTVCDDPPCVDAGTNPDDRDGDGFEACSSMPAGDCDCDDEVAAINPSSSELCGDGIDQDCDGVDSPCDADGDGFAADVDCDDDDPTVYPGASETPAGACDGVDNNCNGLVDEVDECRSGDLDGDGVVACPPGATDTADCDCADCDAGRFGGADSRERCGNTVDDDCDGAVDEGCPDPSMDADGDGQAPPMDCDDTDPFAYTHDPGEPLFERCGDGVAQSCVPGEDAPCSQDLDGDGFVEPPECEGDLAVGPLVAEICNGVDDDCDGVVDEAGGTGGCVDGEVVDFEADFTHCGACRASCPIDAADRCVGGTCDCSTEASSTGPCALGACCADGCVDTETDANNCGACGSACPSGQSCTAGACG